MRKNGLEHLAENERAALYDFVARLQRAYANQVVRVVLFGSKARGDSDAESDLDVLVLINSDDWHVHDQMLTLSSPVSVKYDALISPKVIGPSLYRRMRRLQSLFLENIRREGVILWTKRPARQSAKTSLTAATN